MEKAVPYEEYFGEMDLDFRQEKERVQFSEDFESSVFSALTQIEVLNGFDELNEIRTTRISNELAENYERIYSDYAEPDEEIRSYINIFSLALISATLEHIDDEYYTSLDRAMFVAENEANTSLNHVDYVRAIAKGKTKKTWHTQRDKSVRKTHRSVDGKTININSLFNVGGCLMRYPKDFEADVTGKETVNCRCTIKYS